MSWCGACQDHFDVDHYDEDDNHLAGLEYGPTGWDVLVFRQLAAAEVLIKTDEVVLVSVSLPRALWDAMSTNGT